MMNATLDVHGAGGQLPEREFAARLVRLSTGQRGLRCTLAVHAEAAGSEPVIDFVASDATLDRAGEVIAPAGWRLEQYRRNPVFQNAHNYDSVEHTLGRALSVEIAGGRLLLRVLFAVAANPLARLAYDLYRGGFLRAVSVGFLPLRWENGDDGAPFRRRSLEQELLEVSAVAIPANPNALVLTEADSETALLQAARAIAQAVHAPPASLPSLSSVSATATLKP